MLWNASLKHQQNPYTMIPITFLPKETLSQFLKRAFNQAELNCKTVSLKFPDRTFLFTPQDTLETLKPIMRELYIMMKLSSLGEFSK